MPTQERSVLLAALALGGVAMLWGTSFAIIKDIIDTMAPFTLMMLRFGFSTLILGVLFGHRLKGMTPRQALHSTIIGSFLALAFVALILGIRHTTASNQSFLVGACVIFVPFLGWASGGTRPGGHALAGAALATIGIALLTLSARLTMNTGDQLSLLCSVCVACHMVAIERLGRDMDPVASTLIQMAITTLCFVVLTGCFESYRFAMTPRLWKALAYLVLVTTVLAFTVQNIAQRHLSATSTALILTLETAFGGIFAVLYLHEQPTLKMVAGCTVILLGILTEETRWSFLRRA